MARSVVVVDDHHGFRSETRRLLAGDGFEVVGEAADGGAAIREVARLRPDIVVLDIGLPDTSGLDIVGPLRDASPGSLVVLVSGRREEDYGDRVARSGADGFFEKARLSPGWLVDLVTGLGPR